MKKLLVVLMAVAIAMVVSGCGGATIHPTKAFDANAAQAALAPGKNTIKGSGMMRTQGGQPVTCAGLEVALIPVTEASSEIMMQAFNSTQSGSYTQTGLAQLNLQPGAEVLKVNRKDACDPQGHFLFENVADGNFFLLTHIRWVANPNTMWAFDQGGYVMKNVHVSGGQTVEVDLMPEISSNYIF